MNVRSRVTNVINVTNNLQNPRNFKFNKLEQFSQCLWFASSTLGFLFQAKHTKITIFHRKSGIQKRRVRMEFKKWMRRMQHERADLKLSAKSDGTVVKRVFDYSINLFDLLTIELTLVCTSCTLCSSTHSIVGSARATHPYRARQKRPWNGVRNEKNRCLYVPTPTDDTATSLPPYTRNLVTSPAGRVNRAN